MKFIKKVLSLITILSLLTLRTVPVYAEATGATEAVKATEAGGQQTVQSTPAPSSTPTVTQQVVQSPSPSPTATPAPNEAVSAGEATPVQDSSDDELSSSEIKALERQSETNQTGSLLGTPQYSPNGASSSDNGGDTKLQTGDATNGGNITNIGNNNLLSSGCCNGGATVANTDNGSGSTNNGSATVNDNNTTVQDNNAAVLNNMSQGAYTGGNTASDNDGEVVLETGDANVTGTVLTFVNTNAAGVSVSEFNVNDYTGDLILDLPANCIAGCPGDNILVKNAGNGDDSTNNASLTSNSDNFLVQDNDAVIESNLELFADTGTNTASDNDGAAKITTGDANVSANAVTFANNNIAGNVWYGVVNIFGDLVGDIILPQSVIDSITCSTCGGTTTVANTDNGSGSDNNATLDQNTDTDIYQFNNAAIDNNLILDANTGGNTGSDNDGSVSIESGNANIDANVLNIANTNMVGGNWWLVIVNEAGNWVGKLIGADGSNMAGSVGTTFAIDPDSGAITVTNSGNGDNSQNNAGLIQNTTNNISQTNNAQITNNLNLGANTGLNKASDNDGHSKIQTGDANIVANLVNFVNNNIVGSGKVVPIVINVFGSWLGDFVAPGQEKQNKNNNTNTVVQESNNQSSNESDTNSSSSNRNRTSQSVSVTTDGNGEVEVSGFSNPISNAGGMVSGAFNQTFTQVAAFKASNIGFDSNSLIGSDKAKNKIKINLAWLVLILPVATALVAIKYKTSLLSKLPRKK